MEYTSIFPDAPGGNESTAAQLFDVTEQLIWGMKMHYSRVLEVAREHSDRSEGTADGPDPRYKTRCVELVADIGAFVGTVHRLRSVVDRLPGDVEMRSNKRTFADRVKGVDVARHHLEHIDQSVFRIAGSGRTALGAVSWWKLDQDGAHAQCCVLLPGHPVTGQQAITRVPGVYRDSIDHIWVSIAEADFNLSDVYYAVLELELQLRSWGQRQELNDWPALRTWSPARAKPAQDVTPRSRDEGGQV